jgi:hypothetical protein
MEKEGSDPVLMVLGPWKLVGVGLRENGMVGDMLELVATVTDSHAEGEVRLELGRAGLDMALFCRQPTAEMLLWEVLTLDDHQRQVHEQGGWMRMGKKRDGFGRTTSAPSPNASTSNRRQLATCRKRLVFLVCPLFEIRNSHPFLFLAH